MSIKSAKSLSLSTKPSTVATTFATARQRKRGPHARGAGMKRHGIALAGSTGTDGIPQEDPVTGRPGAPTPRWWLRQRATCLRPQTAQGRGRWPTVTCSTPIARPRARRTCPPTSRTCGTTSSTTWTWPASTTRWPSRHPTGAGWPAACSATGPIPPSSASSPPSVRIRSEHRSGGTAPVGTPVR